MLDPPCQGSPNLKFELAAPPRWKFAAGDRLIGHLIRDTPVVTPKATLKLWLTGNIRTTILPRSAKTTQRRYVDDWDFLEQTGSVIFSGPLHLPDGGENALSWPFSIQIPSQTVARQDYMSKESFLPLFQGHPLPGSFESHGKDRSSEGRIEYALHARLHYTVGTSHKVFNATLPIRIRHPIQEAGPSEFMEFSSPETFMQSQRLLPGMEDADLSLRQKTQKLLGSSKVPMFQYRIVVSLPTVIQLDNPDPVPIILNVVPSLSNTTASIRDIPRTARINWIRLHIKHHTTLLALHDFNPSKAESAKQSWSADLDLEDAFEQLKIPMVISTGEDNKPIDIGTMLRLSLRSNGGLFSDEKMLTWTPKTISPDFTTYTIKHTHELRFNTNVTIAGETQIVKTKATVRIIGAD
ncbi:hypothetical protein N7510_003304 [Penicillium lagena]|uniref:uncharacterized protein n=1 Tax=Penicillium lagena TaxID=94218 RepID=UPI00253F78A1|nr:uncharacterized protein N7510_003304 [Penicillium lagena]KAJ5619320.1 hypothetical protein N7510_003304 [Penicillium lagena]